MKTRLLLLVLALAAMSQKTIAQPEIGQFSVTPKIGGSLNTLTGNPELRNLFSYINQDETPMVIHGNHDVVISDQAAWNAGYSVGAELSYRKSKLMGFTAGLFYSEEGASFGDYEIDITSTSCTMLNVTGYIPAHSDYASIRNVRMKLGYLNVPLTANVYLGKGFSVGAGLQAGFLVNDRIVSEGTVMGMPYSNHLGKKEYRENKEVNGQVCSLYLAMNQKPKDNGPEFEDIKVNKLLLSLPVNLSYEFNRYVVDLRYCIDLRKAGEWETVDSNYMTKSANSRNQVVTLSIGYRFGL